jgi:hypothetical protein
MIRARTLAMCAVVVCSTSALGGQGLSQYRNFALGGDLASVSALAGIASTEAKTIHRRPAVLQDLDWRPSQWIPGSTAASSDPVDRILFSFYDNQLFRVVVDYDHNRTKGMTSADLIEGISAVYGTPLPRAARAAGRAASRLEIESGPPLAQWGDAQRGAALYQTSSYGSTFRLIVLETRLAQLAQKAQAEAVRLDDQEAPRREIARQQKERDDGVAAAAKARVENKAAFRP